MYYIEDEHFARRLQNELQAYENFKQQKENKEKENLNPVDTKLEYIDPTPNIHDLFVTFDKKFFWNTLGMVEVVWSTRMTKCAGLCSFEGGRGLCKIALSAPLLSLRPRKDLVETLLHEMIHAYLFVTHNYKDREDHGPEFHKHMFRINKEAGTKITVYHTFFDEVEYYQRHIWRCNGPCQTRKPYFGFVRRAINRPPGPSDTWWDQHKLTCGGTYIKISEPEKKPKNIKKVVVVKPNKKTKDIRQYFGDNKTSSIIGHKKTEKTSNIKTLADIKEKSGVSVKINSGTGTIVVTNQKKGKSKTKSSQSEISNKIIANKKDQLSLVDFIKNSKKSPDTSKEPDTDNIREKVRNIWADKFSNMKTPSPKKIKLKCPTCEEGFSEENLRSHKCPQQINENNGNKNKIENLLPTTSTSEKTDSYKECPVCSKKIFQSKMNDHLENCLSNCSFVNEGENEDENEITCESVPCPCCYKWFPEKEMNNHIDECLTLNVLKEEFLISKLKS